MSVELYFPPSQNYSRDYVLFLLRNWDFLIAGKYPPEPSDYISTSGPGKAQKAPFEMAAIMRAEISWRLARTGKDGIILFLEAQQGHGYQYLRPESKNALNYIGSGKKRRKTGYMDWLAYRRQDWKQKKLKELERR